MDATKIPAELTKRRQWVCWRYRKNADGKETKVPLTIGGYGADSTDPADWYSFDDVRQARDANGFDGIGFVFTKHDEFCGIDLDNCLDEGELAPWAEKILAKFDGTYAERSPSGKGIKIWCKAKNPLPNGRKEKVDTGAVEVYDWGRFFTFTGDVYDGSAIEQKQSEVDWLVATYFQERSTPKATYSAPISESDKLRAASAYLAKMDPAISGQGGHDTCFRAACKMVLGFELDTDTAYNLLAIEYNPRCAPPWSEKELRHKVDSANSQEGERGYLLREWEAAQKKYPHINLDEFYKRQGLEVTNEVFPIDLLPKSGLMRDLLDYYLQVSIYPEPVMAFSGVLALMATVLGRRVQDPFGTRTNLHIVLLAPSGSGKDTPRKNNLKILNSCQEGYAFIGKDDLVSRAGLMKSLSQRPCGLYQFDEFGHLIQAMGDKRADRNMREAGNLMLKLYSSANSVIFGAAYADGRDTKVDQPHFVLFGTSTPNEFMKGLRGDDVENGFFNRLCVFKPNVEIPTENACYVKAEPPEDLLARINYWTQLQPNGNVDNSGVQEVPVNPVTIPWSLEADARLGQHRREIRKRQSTEDENSRNIWARTAEKSQKFALIHACCRLGHTDGQIEIEDADWGIRLSNHLTRLMVDMTNEHVAETQHEKEAKFIFRIVKQYGIEGDNNQIAIKHSDLLKKSKMKKFHFEQLIDTLRESHAVTENIDDSTGGRPSKVYLFPHW